MQASPSRQFHNHLRYEQSPYLQQHASNPVDWYPWCDEAFAKAERENKPIFLSIGYSTCHWCHVMERESFVDEEVAALLNQYFVAIKVDREERPDIDAVYMAVCQSLTGSGGWPLSIFMTPAQKPFYAGTYLPKSGHRNRAGLLELLDTIARTWSEDAEKLTTLGRRVAEALRKESADRQDNESFTEHDLEQAAAYFDHEFDEAWGGFGGAPKFPCPHQLLFLMDLVANTHEERPFAMAKKTLEAMAAGGIRDHIGGGFARYSTDERWLIPHFEKMLYDNAFLSISYLQAFQFTKEPHFADVAKEIFAFVQRDMTDAQGGFYSALDADVNGAEGKFYTFTPREIVEVLGKAEGQVFCQSYHITEQGNFEGRNVPHRIGAKTPLPKNVDDLKEKLRRYRDLRHKLYRDDKVLTSWNGMMIAAFAEGYRLLGSSTYLQCAKRAFSFLEQHCTYDDGTLAVHWRNGSLTGRGFLDDYCYMSYGALALYRATLDLTYLQKAINLAEDIRSRFWDESHGGCFLYEKDAPSLILRPKECYDGALPSGNSIFLKILTELSILTGESRWLDLAQAQAAYIKGQIASYPQIAPMALSGAMEMIFPHRRAVFVTDTEEERRSLIAKAKRITSPNTYIICGKEGEPLEPDFLRDFQRINGQTTCYLCHGTQCDPPTNNIDGLWAALQS